MPGDGKIEFDTVTYPQPAPGSLPGWRFPDGTVLVKTFSLDTGAGQPDEPPPAGNAPAALPSDAAAPRRSATRSGTATPTSGTTTRPTPNCSTPRALDREYTIKDAEAPGGKRKQIWHFPSRAECTMCHTVTAKYALGVNTLQMNKDHDYGGVIANQLRDARAPRPVHQDSCRNRPEKLPQLADYHDKTPALEARARAYLHANCSHCHRKWGGGNAEFQLLATLPLKETGTLDTRPGQGPST